MVILALAIIMSLHKTAEEDPRAPVRETVQNNRSIERAIVSDWPVDLRALERERDSYTIDVCKRPNLMRSIPGTSRRETRSRRSVNMRQSMQ